MDTGSTLGQRLAFWRRRAGRTQRQIASVLGVEPVTVSRYETGITDPSRRVILTYAEQCGASVTERGEALALPVAPESAR